MFYFRHFTTLNEQQCMISLTQVLLCTNVTTPFIQGKEKIPAIRRAYLLGSSDFSLLAIPHFLEACLLEDLSHLKPA